MMNSTEIISPLTHKSASKGFFLKNSSGLRYKNGRNIIIIKEHFDDNNRTAEGLLENVICYEGNNQN